MIALCGESTRSVEVSAKSISMLNRIFFIVRLTKDHQKPPALPVLQSGFSSRFPPNETQTTPPITTMNIIAQLDQSIEVARQQGYHVRFDWFGGTGGGVCQVNGRKVLFIDLALSAVEQLELVQANLDGDLPASSKRAA